MLIKSTDAVPSLTHKQIERPVSAQGTCIYMYHVHACIHKCVYLSAQTVLGWHKWRMLKLQVYIYRIGKVINNLITMACHLIVCFKLYLVDKAL